MTQPPLTEANKDTFRNKRPSSSFVHSTHTEIFVRHTFHLFQSARGLCNHGQQKHKLCAPALPQHPCNTETCTPRHKTISPSQSPLAVTDSSTCSSGRSPGPALASAQLRAPASHQDQHSPASHPDQLSPHPVPRLS